eukprot:CAMPEP_0197426322 /NCGR_PEP_ID=MMETSP1170-20131217/34410_1 /TAXON_ID=54406 /ORGANISM="Sarcinochrysis sp, Strain CCMP770" /LENGTH=129 /DNA_ID=CAMNT_0042953949 /DNA_START=239 /DNA_END=625 /DNA_ORIENTATION=+
MSGDFVVIKVVGDVVVVEEMTDFRGGGWSDAAISVAFGLRQVSPRRCAGGEFVAGFEVVGGKGFIDSDPAPLLGGDEPREFRLGRWRRGRRRRSGFLLREACAKWYGDLKAGRFNSCKLSGKISTNISI